jgi:hypothetical protein
MDNYLHDHTNSIIILKSGRMREAARKKKVLYIYILKTKNRFGMV